ncbi:hypothetical protein Naga_100056g18 [Nannochloropsis gaditana]|uniref:Uncharacterized protein n=1 Tax=Nannochloropsis gaditana TaxID=72520 RepID=W7TU68_9STRA|nr:hypothetical protein Naga_100056g18 [Nannochloropsis gaditana]
MRRHPWRAQELSVLLLAFAALVTARQLMCRGPLSSTSSRRTHRGRLAFDYPAYDTNPAQYASGGPPPPPPPPGGLYHAHPPPAQHQPHHQRSPERTGTPASGPGQYPPPPPPPPHHHQHQQAQQPPHPQDQWGGPGGYGQGGSPPPRQDGPGAEGPGRYDQGQPVGGENYGAYYGSQGEHGYGAYYGVPPGQGGQGGARTEGPSVGEKLKGLWGSFKEKIASGVDSVSKSSTVENGLRYLARDYDQPGGGSGGYYGGPVYDSQGGHQAPQSLPGGGAYGPPATHMHQSPQGAGSWSSPGRDGSGPGARYGPPSSRGVPPPPPPPAYFPPGEKQPLSYPPPSRQPAYPPREAGSPRTPHGPGTPAEEDEPSQHRIVNEMQDRYRAQGRRGEEDEATRHGWPTQPVPGPGPGPSGGRLGPGGPWGHPPPAQQPQAPQYQQREGQRPGQGGAKAPPYVHGVDDRPPYFSQQQQQAFARPPPSQHGGFPHSQQDYGPPPPTSHGHGPPPPASSYPTPGPGHGAGTDAAPGTQQPQQAPQEEVQSQRPYPTLEEEGEGEKGKGESVPPASSAAGSYQGKDSTERTRPTGSARTSPSEEVRTVWALDEEF